jgi:hypothetical protein
MNALQQIEKAIEDMPSASFKNEHGEKFTIHTDGTITFMSGDEVGMMVDSEHKYADKYIPLFSEHFNIWSPKELNKLGKALQEVTEKM